MAGLFAGFKQVMTKVDAIEAGMAEQRQQLEAQLDAQHQQFDQRFERLETAHQDTAPLLS